MAIVVLPSPTRTCYIDLLYNNLGLLPRSTRKREKTFSALGTRPLGTSSTVGRRHTRLSADRCDPRARAFFIEALLSPSIGSRFVQLNATWLQAFLNRLTESPKRFARYGINCYSPDPRMTRICQTLFITLFICTACGATSDASRKEWLRRLKDAIHSQVDSRETNQKNSRTVEQALDEEALKNLMRFQVKRALGSGHTCEQHPRCQQLGFQSDDLYYTVGEGDETKIGKRPMLIVGFDHEGNVVRVWNLRVH